MRFTNFEPHSCGFPADPAKVAQVEATFGRQSNRKSGCLAITTMFVLIMMGSLFMFAVT